MSVSLFNSNRVSSHTCVNWTGNHRKTRVMAVKFCSDEKTHTLSLNHLLPLVVTVKGKKPLQQRHFHYMYPEAVPINRRQTISKDIKYLHLPMYALEQTEHCLLSHTDLS